MFISRRCCHIQAPVTLYQITFHTALMEELTVLTLRRHASFYYGKVIIKIIWFSQNYSKALQRSVLYSIC